jgi:hypothetical protein
MSQILQVSSSGPTPGGILTLTGNSGGAVGPTLGNIDVVGAGLIDVVGNPGTSTLTISLSNSAVATAITVGAVPVNIISVPVADSQMVTITAVINGIQDDFSDCWGGDAVFTVYRPTGGDVTVVGGIIANASTTSTADISGTVNIGTEMAEINVIGVAAETWNWSASYQFFYQP